jgi:hypothetical protein
MIVIYAFVNFLFLKILTEMMFREGLSVLACALIAIATGMILGGLQMNLAVTIGAWADRIERDNGRPQPFPLGVAALAIALAVAACVGAGYLIAIGFSEKFMARLDHYQNEHLIWLPLVLAIGPASWAVTTVTMLRGAAQREMS